ncbi:hypothetical protein [Nonomuraea sp. NPDC050310]|uniref:hypothetical protein n=1 Tax=Nonomuraea sp. NPDC050310 TaxID=3154935 RepID=UPI0033D5C5A2
MRHPGADQGGPPFGEPGRGWHQEVAAGYVLGNDPAEAAVTVTGWGPGHCTGPLRARSRPSTTTSRTCCSCAPTCWPRKQVSPVKTFAFSHEVEHRLI